MITVYIIALGFTDWDQCWNFYHANRALMDSTAVAEFCVEGDAEPPGMRYSLRPKSREDKQ